MKIIFIGKKTSKPKSISLASLILILFILLSLNIYLFNYFFKNQELNSDSILSNFKLTEDVSHNRQCIDI